MSERYSKLFAPPENLYTPGAPVVIAAGALLKDSQTGKVLVQLKLRSIQDKRIKAAKVSVIPLDTVGKPLGGSVAHQYLDLDAARDIAFGQKSPIALPDPATRAFSAAVTEVIFADNTVWTASGAPWAPLAAPMLVANVFRDPELAKQYLLKFGSDCTFFYQKDQDLWHCTCGALNHQSEPACHHCRRAASLLAALDPEALKADRDARLQKEAAERAAAEAKARKTRKLAMILIPIAVVAIVAVSLISSTLKNTSAYNSAAALLAAGDYDGATAAFEALGDYKDSADQALQAQYDKAMALMAYGESGSEEGLSLVLSEGEAISSDANLSKLYYQEAIEIFEALDTYKDSRKMADSAQYYLEQSVKSGAYNNVLEQLENGEYIEDYIDAFWTLMDMGDYEDSQELANLAVSKIFEYIKEDFGIGDDDRWRATYDAENQLITVAYNMSPGSTMTPEEFLASADTDSRLSIQTSIEDTWYVFDDVFMNYLGVSCQVCYYLDWNSGEPVFTYPS